MEGSLVFDTSIYGALTVSAAYVAVQGEMYADGEGMHQLPMGEEYKLRFLISGQCLSE